MFIIIIQYSNNTHTESRQWNDDLHLALPEFSLSHEGSIQYTVEVRGSCLCPLVEASWNNEWHLLLLSENHSGTSVL